MRTRIAAGIAALGSLALVGSGAGTALALDPTAPKTTAASTNSAPTAVLLTNGGTSFAVLSLSTGRGTTERPFTGLRGDTRFVGIDYRVQDDRLYGVGDAGGVYLVSLQGPVKKVKQLTVPLEGTDFGVDFNPAANALRIVSDTGQNLRQGFTDLTAATNVDGPLNYTAGVTATGIAAAAYTNNDLSDQTATTLFVLDGALDQVAVQVPANNGSLSPTGKTGADVGADAGFDIFSQLDGNGRTTAVTGYVTTPTVGGTALHRVSLLTGQVALERTLPVSATDIAILLVPAPAPA